MQASSRFRHRLLRTPRWAKTLGLAVIIVACEPMGPINSCGGGGSKPSCADRSYTLALAWGLYLDLQTGAPNTALTLDSLGVEIFPRESPSAETAFKLPGTGSCAYACSQIACESTFEPDSIAFSTDMVAINGDTLRAGHNFATPVMPVGFTLYFGNRLRIDSLAGFRDSLFDVRFHGTIDGVEKSASAQILVTNPALLLP